MITGRLPLVVMIPRLIYGPGDTSSVRTTFLQYLQRKLPLLPAKTAFSWAHVDDIVCGHILAMAATIGVVEKVAPVPDKMGESCLDYHSRIRSRLGGL